MWLLTEIRAGLVGEKDTMTDILSIKNSEKNWRVLRFSVVESIPIDSFDIKMDKVVTNSILIE